LKEKISGKRFLLMEIRVANFPLPTYLKWENGKSVVKWENGLGNGKMGKPNGRSRQTYLNVRLRYIETRKIDVSDSNRCK
jgi:hypothetical protein